MKYKKEKQGRCVFCGRADVTKQHMWPDWIKSVIPRNGNDHIHFLTKINRPVPEVAVIQPELQQKRGPLGARKIRNVCSKCNSGWMSKLEEGAKYWLTELMLRRPVMLDQDSQLRLAAWTVMTSIIAEYTDKPTQSIPPEHRHHLMTNSSPPDGWYVWVGAYEGQHRNLWYHHYGLTSARVDESKKIITTPEWNTQFSTFVIGGLMIHAASTAVANALSLIAEFKEHGLTQIWPIHNRELKLPGIHVLSDNDVNRIANELCYRLFFPSV